MEYPYVRSYNYLLSFVAHDLHRSRRFTSHFNMLKMGAREFVYPNFGYRSRWLRNRDPVYPSCVQKSVVRKKMNVADDVRL